MLERFHVSAEDEIRVAERALRETVTAIFVATGVPDGDAADGADALVMADLRGVETHGVSNMLRRYVDWYRAGVHNPDPRWIIERESPATATIDGDRGLGIMQGFPAMRLAIEKARNVGVGAVTMRNSGHLGGIGHFAMLAAEENMIGLCMTASSLLVPPTFGAVPRIGTNPIAYAAPANRMPFVLFDAAMSTIASNKIGLSRRLGALLEPGWIAGLDGTPVSEPVPAPADDDYYLLPLGGTREQGSHKGYGLGLFVEIMTTLLSGSIPRMIERDTRPRHFFAAFDIAAFTDVAEFKDTMDRMLETLEETPPAPGHDRVYYPGLPEFEAERERRERGIPLHVEVIDWFDRVTAELSLLPLARLSDEP
ncbi:MAG TPA: Ldh family oxidoreductase [Thermomicrobiales bacterium]|nr:Ldh family oxidoreductase [Thermomicrobiales bacterium]